MTQDLRPVECLYTLRVTLNLLSILFTRQIEIHIDLSSQLIEIIISQACICGEIHFVVFQHYLLERIGHFQPLLVCIIFFHFSYKLHQNEI